MKVDVQGAHPESSARETTEIENDSGRALEGLEPTGLMSPLRLARMEFTTPRSGDYFLLLGLQCGDAIAADRCCRRHQRSDMREKSHKPDMASAFAL
jgi:hypothetical protein